MSHVLEEHRQYLADRARLDAFTRALGARIRPGDVVLDLGSGTGVLGLLACRAGAARVYAVDAGPVVGLARDVAAANGFGDRIRVLRRLSTQVVLPEPVDVVVTDQIGPLGFDVGLVEYMDDARARLLAPGGRLIPEALEVHMAPCESDAVRTAVDFWDGPVAGLDFSAGRRLSACSMHVAELDPSALLSAPALVGTLDLAGSGEPVVTGEASFAATRAGRLDGLAGWFVARLAPGVTMTNAPGHALRIRRRHAVLPLEQPVSVAAGDTIRLRVRMRPLTAVVDWDVVVERPDEAPAARARQSTFEGCLFSSEDLRRTHPGHVPALTEAGRARRLVLDLCDGRRTTGEIEREVRARHEALLPTAERAAAFVAQVLTPHVE